jgi:hypothetical protein
LAQSYVRTAHNVREFARVVAVRIEVGLRSPNGATRRLSGVKARSLVEGSISESQRQSSQSHRFSRQPAPNYRASEGNRHFVRVYAIRNPFRSALRWDSLPASATIIARSQPWSNA